jgi:hypothetical protein
MPAIFATETVLKRCGGRLGYPDGSLFVMPEGDAVKILEDNDYDGAAVRRSLGVPEAAWTDVRIFMVQIPQETISNLRMPSGNEAGVDRDWLPGGIHRSGAREAVVDPVRLDQCSVMEVQWKS